MIYDIIELPSRPVTACRHGPVLFVFFLGLRCYARQNLKKNCCWLVKTCPSYGRVHWFGCSLWPRTPFNSHWNFVIIDPTDRGMTLAVAPGLMIDNFLPIPTQDPCLYTTWHLAHSRPPMMITKCKQCCPHRPGPGFGTNPMLTRRYQRYIISLATAAVDSSTPKCLH